MSTTFTFFLIIFNITMLHTEKYPTPTEVLIEDFQQDQHLDWNIINDGVMGGVSQSAMSITPEGFGKFSGRVSLENNGGFASTRASIKKLDLSESSQIVLRVKGDGQRYSFRIRTDRYFDGVSYKASFDTQAGEWITIQLPYKDFVPTFRGRKVSAPPLTGAQVSQIGFLISDKQEGPFELLIDWIKAG